MRVWIVVLLIVFCGFGMCADLKAQVSSDVTVSVIVREGRASIQQLEDSASDLLNQGDGVNQGSSSLAQQELVLAGLLNNLVKNLERG